MESKVTKKQIAPVFWNKMESLVSEIGANLTLSGTVNYSPVKFNNGAGNPVEYDGNNRLNLTWTYTPKGCIEMWYKPNYTSSDTNVYNPIILDFRTQLAMLITYNPVNNSWYNYYPSPTNTTAVAVEFDSGVNFVPGDLIHIAMVWNTDGIAGSARTMEFYVNGVRRTRIGGTALDTAAIYASNINCVGVKLLGRYADPSTPTAFGWIDNLKIYDYDKTDFSDRFIEASPISEYELSLSKHKEHILFSKEEINKDEGTVVVRCKNTPSVPTSTIRTIANIDKPIHITADGHLVYDSNVIQSNINLSSLTDIGVTWKKKSKAGSPVIDTGLQLWNKLGSSTEVTNSEIGPNLVPVGTPVYGAAQFGNGLVCSNGSEAYVSSWQSVFPNKYAFTVECWVKFNSWYITNGLSSNALSIMMDASGEDTAGGWAWGIFSVNFRSTGCWASYNDGSVANGGSELNATATIPTTYSNTLNSVAHFAFTYEFKNDIGYMRLYIDGTLMAEGTAAHIDGLNYSKDGKFHIGDTRDSYSTYEFKNTIDNLKIYNYAKTDFSDRFYEGAMPPQDPGLVFWNKLEGITFSGRVESEIGPDLLLNTSCGGNSSHILSRTGIYGKSMWINSNTISKYALELPNQNLVLNKDTGTIEFWYFQQEPPLAYSYGVYRVWNGSFGNGDITKGIRVDVVDPATNGGFLRFGVYFGNASSAINLIYLKCSRGDATTNSFNNKWTHIAYSWDRNAIGQKLSVYVDGVKQTIVQDSVGVAGQWVYYSTNGSNIDNALWLSTVSGKADILSGQDASYQQKFAVDNLKIYNYAKTDFSDRFYEDGVIKYPGLVLWNKLGSVTEVNKSEVGPDGLLTGAPTYPVAQFNNGISNGNVNGRRAYFPNVSQWFPPLYNPTGACVECWIKFNTGTNYGVPFHINNNTNGLRTSGNYSDLGLYVWNTNPATIYLYVFTGTHFINIDPIPNVSLTHGTLYHIALTWNFVGGISGGADTVRLYINGVIVFSSTSALPANHPYAPEYSFILNEHPFGRANNLIIDNLKVWDYAKTDFEDRFAEVPTDRSNPQNTEVVKKLYVNGVKQQEITEDGELTLAKNRILIGANQELLSQGHVICDSIVVSKREFSEEEMEQLAESKDIK